MFVIMWFVGAEV